MKAATAIRLVSGVALVLASAALPAQTRVAPLGPATVVSPGARLMVTIAGTGSRDRGTWRYRLERDTGGQRVSLLGWSPLGLTLEDDDLTTLRLTEVSAPRTVRDAYTQPHGKRRARTVLAVERQLSFVSPGGTRLQVTVRVSDDGLAFRYTLPDRRASKRIVRAEATGFAVPSGSRGWMQPHQLPGRWAPAYEDLFREIDAGAAAPTEQGWSYPALFRLPDRRHWLLLTEAGLDEHYAGSRLASDAANGVYRVRLPDPAEGLGHGAVEPQSATPWVMPWRVVIAGDGLAPIVESTLVEDLSPAAVGDFTWVRPGRASYGWWIDDDASKKEEVLKAFIDLSAEMTWEYSLIDANWHLAPEGTIDRVVAYARERHVGLILWYNSGGPHNDVTEWGPRDRLFDPVQRRREFARLKAQGIAGVKVDFWHSDKQDLIGLYMDMLRDAAAARLLIDFHGATIPRGWSRTYPNLVSMEAVFAAEQYKYSEKFAEAAARHNATLPFTRNVIGPMDYTPVTFSDAKYPHRTTNAHELALSVVFESGIVHFADSPESYRALPPAAHDFLMHVPAAWDDTRLLDGEPGRLAVIARRQGRGWWVGGVSGLDTPQIVPVDLSFLGGEGEWDLTIVRDGGAPRQMTSEATAVRPVDHFNVPLLPRGGFVMRIAPK